MEEQPMKWLLAVVAVVVVMAGAVALIGMSLPQNHVVSRSAHLAVPPDSLWAVITDVDSYPAWRKDVDSVQRVEGTRQLTWREISGGERMTYEVTASEKPTRFVTHIADKGLPFGGSWDYRIEPEGTGSKVTITENGEVYNPVFRFVSRFIMGHTATLDKYLTALAAKTGEKYVPSDG
jgi:uncharacterized protein YndB with AHSA1/START domain